MLAAKTLETVHVKLLFLLVFGLIKHQAIKILNQDIVFLFILYYQQQVQNILITFFGYLNRIKLFVFIAENVDIDSILPLKFSIIFYTNRELNALIIKF